MDKRNPQSDTVATPSENADPITGEHGAHPIGTGVGAVAGGLAAGAALGAATGPVGAVVGAAVGTAVGGLAGKSAAEVIDPTVEDAYWRQNYTSRDYVQPGASYDEYQPAYRYGWESRARLENCQFEDVEDDLEKEWATAREPSHLDWKSARPATKDAWARASQPDRGDSCAVPKPR